MRRLAEAVGCSKSAAHRHRQAQERRDQYPESPFWETDAGHEWQRLLFFAVLYQFGLGSGVGADNLSRFFKLIRLDNQMGVSPSSLRSRLDQMESLLIQFQRDCEQQAGPAQRKATLAMDETFFGNFLILVLMDLHSGYLLLEDISDDRRFETWHQKAAPRLQSLGIEANHAISDRAKALIKLATTGFQCESGADVFHAQQDISRWLGPSIGKRVRTAEQACEGLPDKPEKADDLLIKETLESTKQAQTDYYRELRGISTDLQPFRLEDSAIQHAWQVETALEQRLQSLQSLAEGQGIGDKQDTAKKFRHQITALASSVNAWWLWVHELLQEMAPEKALRDWLATALLPVVYWHYQQHRTQNAQTRQQCQRAWQQASEALRHHALTPSLSDHAIQHWLNWSQWMVRQFHRSSSAVEGRNGCLSQLYHNGRGLTEQRLKALTVIHNYGLQRQDGTTAAMRLFNTEFADPFAWLLNEMGELPLPRKGRRRSTHNPLELLGCPALSG